MPDRDALDQLQTALADAGRSVKIIPVGADEPLSPIPDTVDVTDGDIRLAVADWDRAAADGYVERAFRGLLASDVVEEGK